MIDSAVDSNITKKNTFAAFAARASRLGDWIKRNERNLIVFAILFQIVVLSVIVAMPAKTVISGEKVQFKVAPIDPRSLFRGDFVILGYDFSSIPAIGIAGQSAEDLVGETVFVFLEPEEDSVHYKAKQFLLTQPASGPFIKGKVVKGGRIEFGIESFFVQEGEGLKYEQAARTKKLSAEVVLDQSGKAVLSRLVIR